jgi:hypothetical protein
MPQLEDAFRYGYWQHFVHPIDTVLLSCKAMVVNDATENAIRNGTPVTLANSACAGLIESHQEDSSLSLCRTYTLDGRFLGVLRFDQQRGQWQPEKVFPSPDC